MRVTDGHRHHTILRQLAIGQRAILDATRQAVTGRRVSRFSEDPGTSKQVVEADSTLRALAQYQRNAAAVRHRLETAETALQQVTDLLSRAKELATGQVGGNANAATRAATAGEVRQLFQQVISLGNLHQGGEFLFGGLHTDTAPFQADGTYLGTPTSRLADLGGGGPSPTIPSGQEMLIDTGVLAALTQLESVLDADDAAGVLASMSALDAAFDAVQVRLAEVGGRDRSLTTTMDMLIRQADALTIRRADLAEIPLEEAVLRLSTAQTTLEAIYLTTSRTLTQTLTAYLR